MPDIQVMGVCPDRPAAERVVGNLRLAGFDQDGVALIMVRRDESAELANVADQQGEGAREVARSAAKSALVGALLGLVLGAVTLNIPGLRVLSTVILLALFVFSGAFVGALAGAFASEDVSSEVIDRYGMALREGQAVIRVKAPDAEAAKRAEEVLSAFGAANVNSYLEDDTKVTDIPGVTDVSR
jgi:hypothetical protein